LNLVGNYIELSSRKRILFLTPGFPENEQDTRCIPALQIFVNELKNRGLFELTVISFHYPYKAKEYVWRGVKVHALGGDNKRGLRRLLTLKKAVRLAIEINSYQAFDYIHSFWLGECAWVGNKLSRKENIPHTCTLMGQDALKDNAYLKKLRTLPKLITLSEFHHKQLLKSAAIESQIIPWGIEQQHERALEKSIDIVSVGNLTAIKSQSRFIYILSKVVKEHPNLKAEIIGEGNDANLKKLIQQYGLEKNVTIVGVLNRETTLDKIAKARCLIHCSIYESFGMVLVEAMGLGTKVFSTPVGIAPELRETIIYRTNEELIPQLIAFLNANDKVEKKSPFTIEKTVDEYINKVFLT